MQLVVHLLVNAVAIIITAYVLPGVHVSDFFSALIAAAILGIINTFIKPLIVLVTLPLTILTLGLFILVINSAVILLAAAVVPGFAIDGFWWALLFSIVLWVVNSLLDLLLKRSQ